jgi:hypothetical protein
LDCPSATALTGFGFRHCSVHPVIDGVVIPSRFEKQVKEEIRERLTHRAERDARPRKCRYFAALEKHYGSPENALLDAGIAICLLNRYCFITAYKRDISDAVMPLKYRLIRVLHASVENVSVERYFMPLRDEDYMRFKTFEERDRYHATGLPKMDNEVHLIFNFVIKGIRFSLSQPEDSVTYPVVIGSPYVDEKDNVSSDDYPVLGTTFCKATALVRWVVEDWEKKQTAT